MKHLTTNQVDPMDFRFIDRKPDVGFNPEKNYAVIREVVADGLKFHELMKHSYQKETEDRIDILSTYARHALGGGEKKLEDFVGKEWMKKIYGEKILEKLRVAESVKRMNRANGNTKFENYYLT